MSTNDSLGDDSRFIRRTGRRHQPTQRYGFGSEDNKGDKTGYETLSEEEETLTGVLHQSTTGNESNHTAENKNVKRKQKKKSKLQKDRLSESTVELGDQKYPNIESWTHAQWSIVLGMTSHKIEDGVEYDLPVDVVPYQVKRRFGALCFVRRAVRFMNTSNLQSGSNVNEHWFPALELNPLHVRGHLKHKLRRDWLLAVDELREELDSRADTNETIDNEIRVSYLDDTDNAHLVCFLGVGLGGSKACFRNRTREPFVLVKGKDFMSMEAGFNHGYTELPHFLQDKLSLLQKNSVNSIDDLLEPWEVELLVGLGMLLEKVQEYDCNEVVKFITEEYVSDDAADDEVSSYGSHTDSQDGYLNNDSMSMSESLSQKSSLKIEEPKSSNITNEVKPTPKSNSRSAEIKLEPSPIHSRTSLPDIPSSNVS